MFLGAIYAQMVRNILMPLYHVNLTRFDVSFQHEKRDLNSFIGRAAHIFFLDQSLYIRMMLYVYRKYFE